MHDSKSFPEPANTVSGGLGLANMDFLNFLPMTCVWSSFDYYDVLIVKTMGPFVVLALLWTIPLVQRIRGKPRVEAVQLVAKKSLIFLDLIYISVSTTVIQCFVCDSVGGSSLLRAQLTLPCDGSTRRRAYVVYASFAVLLYPIGVPALLLALLYPKRGDIRTLMEAAKLQDQEAQSAGGRRRNSWTGITSLGRMVSKADLGSGSKRIALDITDTYDSIKW